VAELNAPVQTDAVWTGAQRRAQYAAVSRLRWQMFRNGLRRKGGKGDLWATLAAVPLALFILGGLCIGAGAAAAFAAELGPIERVSWVLWGIFLITQLVNLNVGQPGTTFDPTQLIRFPMTLSSYTGMRLFFGLLSPGNLIVTAMSLAAAGGVTLSRPELAGWAFGAMAVFALVNVLFTRMVFAWVDRWLSTRRAREAMTALIFLVSIGAQALNFMYNPAYHNRRVDLKTVRKMHHAVTVVEPYLRVLPPEIGGESLAAASGKNAARFAEDNLISVAWGGLFLAVFGLRMGAEYRGENLSDAANAVRVPKTKLVVAHTSAAANGWHGAGVSAAVEFVPAAAGFVPAASRPIDVVRAVAAKELLYLRRNTGLFYGLIMPLVMVMVFAGRWTGRAGTHGPLIFIAALAYGLLGVFPMSFNSFGLEGTGAQTYFFAPVRLREVMIGKNVLCAGVALVETVAIVGVLSYSAGPPPVVFLAGALLWMTTALLLELTVGNYMSIRSPKRVQSGRTAQKQTRAASAFLSMGILLGAGGVGAAVTFLAGLGRVIWVVPIVFAGTAAAAGWIYLTNLNKVDAYAWVHRDALFEELQRKT
jgi:ABC-2 type transport system permease protein